MNADDVEEMSVYEARINELQLKFEKDIEGVIADKIEAVLADFPAVESISWDYFTVEKFDSPTIEFSGIVVAMNDGSTINVDWWLDPIGEPVYDAVCELLESMIHGDLMGALDLAFGGSGKLRYVRGTGFTY